MIIEYSISVERSVDLEALHVQLSIDRDVALTPWDASGKGDRAAAGWNLLHPWIGPRHGRASSIVETLSLKRGTRGRSPKGLYCA